MILEKLTIAVTGLNAIDSPGPGVAVIRALKEAKSFDVRIIGLCYDTLEPGIYMHDIIDRTYQIPYPSEGTAPLTERLEYIHSKEKLNVIIPNFDAELYSFMKLEKLLKQMGIHMFLPTLEQFEERHKANLSKFGIKYDIKVPLSKTISSANDFNELKPDMDFPFMVKGKWYDAYIAYNMEQANNYFNKITAKWGLPVIAQEFVHGTEYNLIGLGDGLGGLAAAVPMRKQYITDKGKAWGGISIDDKKLIGIARRFVAQTKWKGGFELEMIRDQENNYYLVEINPRIPAWVYLAVGAGQNIPEILVQLAMGYDIQPLTEYKVGKMFVRYSWDMIVDREEFEAISMNGEL
ncbi:MAG: ATP-grasp domain-containing protein [Bacteroidales bacterium]|nr:ATP-grasp domain-containing protein [Bacteroidales bacterium]